MSLIRLLKKRRRFLKPKCSSELDSQLVADLGAQLVSLALDPETILVNIQSVVNDLVVSPDQQFSIDWRDTPQATPPFARMWCEARVFGRLLGFQVLRWPCRELVNYRADEHHRPAMVESRWNVGIYFWQEHHGEVMGPRAHTLMWMDHAGTILRSILEVIDRVPESLMLERAEMYVLLSYLVANALARMNCRNVVLRSSCSPKTARRHQRDVVPATVWHEIRITNVPQTRMTGRGVLGRDASKMRRFWVRGHFADYRNGPGLFGNPKLRCVFWIPEHERGNSELGDVIPEYILA